jgi:DNA-binding MarR family transcriptional regulator
VRTGQSSRNLNLTHPQYLVMLALWETSPRSAREISESLMLGAATLSPLLKRLEASGYLTRGRAHGDERSLAVSLTPSRNRAAGAGPGNSRDHARQTGPQP